jgi:NTP pyrophosphatase (non-canonical NTP hydrolase)
MPEAATVSTAEIDQDELVVVELRERAAFDSLLVGLITLQGICFRDSYKAGWWDNVARDASGQIDPNVVGTKLALIHSEVSEALEGFRKGLQDDHLNDRPMIEVELADAVIRIGDLAGALGLDLGGAVVEKLKYNRSRPDHRREARAAEGGKKV